MGVSARQIKIGIKTAATWGTAVAVGTGSGQTLREDFRDDPMVQVSEQIAAGETFVSTVQAGRVAAIKAALPMYLTYSDVFQNIFWAHVLGTGGIAPTQVGTTTAYTNTFEPATGGRDGLFATIVRDKVQKIVEIPSAKFTGFELRFGENGRAEVMWNFVGMKAIENSAINTATQISALTFPPNGIRAFFEQVVVRLNLQSGGALSAPTDVISGTVNAGGLTDLVIRFDQPLDEKYVGGVAGIIEPLDNGWPTFEIEMTFARFDAVSKLYTGYQVAQTALKMDVTFTGPLIGGLATRYGLLFQFPAVFVATAQDPIPASAIQSQPNVKLKAYLASAAPTGMTVTRPVRVTTTGSSSANPFV